MWQQLSCPFLLCLRILSPNSINQLHLGLRTTSTVSYFTVSYFTLCCSYLLLSALSIGNFHLKSMCMRRRGAFMMLSFLVVIYTPDTRKYM